MNVKYVCLETGPECYGRRKVHVGESTALGIDERWEEKFKGFPRGRSSFMQ